MQNAPSYYKLVSRNIIPKYIVKEQMKYKGSKKEWDQETIAEILTALNKSRNEVEYAMNLVRFAIRENRTVMAIWSLAYSFKRNSEKQTGSTWHGYIGKILTAGI